MEDETHASLREQLNGARATAAVEPALEASLNTPLLYVNAVRAAFAEHFGDDEEFHAMFKDIGIFEATSIAIKAMRYRDMRVASGEVLMDCAHGTVGRRNAATCHCFSDSSALRDVFVRHIGFAELAYEFMPGVLRKELKGMGHELVSHEPATGMFEPAYFVSLNASTRELVVSVRGTSSSADWLTNLFIKPGALALKGEKPEDCVVHGGMLQAARFLLARAGQLIRSMSAAGFAVVVVGHSLGGGVATVLAVILREEVGMRDVRCVAYAAPPAVSRRLATLARDYVSCIVNGDDVIPRTSVGSLKNMGAVLARLRALHSEGDWATTLDRQSFQDLYATAVTLKVEKAFDTYLPGRVLCVFPHGERSLAMEVDAQYPPLRLLALSNRMIADHSLVAYRAALTRAADNID